MLLKWQYISLSLRDLPVIQILGSNEISLIKTVKFHLQVGSRGSQAFLFSMVNPHGLGPTNMPINKNQLKGFYCDCSLGPTFGGNRDLQVISGKVNRNTSGYSHLGFCFDAPPGQQATFLAGVKKFTVTDYEVFGLCT